eukprot:TCONS_00057519-protein
MASKSVEIISPNGRRHKIKTSPSMTVMDILNQACGKFGCDPSLYDLKHLKKVLNTSSIIRYLNISNNAKLEIVALSIPRKTDAKPTVALQLEGGQRLTEDFDSKTTLYDVIKCFQDKIENGDLLRPGLTIVYMRNEYKGTPVLRSTTLQGIGITGARVALRLFYRTDIDTEESKENEHTNVEGPTEKKAKLTETATPTGDITNTKTADINHLTVDNKLHDATPHHRESDEVLSKQHQQHPVDKICQDSQRFEQSYQQTPQNVHQNNLQNDQINQHNPFARNILPDNATFGNQSIFPETTPSTNSSSFNHQHVESSRTENQFANFKFPEKKEACEEDIEAIDPQALRQEVLLSMACDRHALLFEMRNQATSTDAEQKDVKPMYDDFYDVTVEDLGKRMQVLTSAKKESTLMTKAMRERRDLERAAMFEKVVVRFLLPDRKHAIQAFFRPLETVKSLREFLRPYLHKSIKKFDLFTTPPKNVLKDQKSTLYQAKLCPASRVYVSLEKTDHVLGESYLDCIKSVEEAQNLLTLHLNKNKSIENTTLQDGKHIPDKIPNSTEARNTITAAQNKKYNAKPKDAPKWFKTGK